ncbi:ABC transporter substrate-binding protein [Elioraea rosea]|uniref:ABC transporter substrate-binding protein n=1 Tax=Elioraea rosea TaxID=2492390 RepID=UPI00118319C4|nr:ABC transporter substrate-binding protein [Elioraea rosea]
MRRRQLFRAGAALAASASFPAPAITQPAAARVLKFVPQADVTILDPMVTTAYPTRNHGHMVWDTLYGLDEHFRPQPQLAEGHVVEDDGHRWTFTLRDGPTFHDGEKVRAADAMASIERWMARDTHGQTLKARLAGMEVLDDRRFEMRLTRPFGPMLDALAKASSYPCFVMPERLARTPATTAIAEIIGSGPYRFRADERVSGAQLVYERYDRYVPREGMPSMTAGPKLAHFDRMEWRIIPDAGTAAAALQAGEVDWWEQVANDLRPVVQRHREVVVDRVDTSGIMAMMRPNHLHPPFDTPERRRALWPAIAQADYMTAIMGADGSVWRDGVGCFPVASPMASDMGIETVTGARSLEAAKAALDAAGYGGEKVVFLHPTDVVNNNALSIVAVDAMRRAGLAVEPAPSDWGTVLGRRAKKDPPDQGGWNVVIALFAGADLMNPGAHLLLRGNGEDAWFGWPTSPELEALREEWFDAPDAEAQALLGRRIQARFWQDVPYWPLGQYFVSSAWRRSLTGVLKGMVLPLNVRRA